MIQFDTRNNAKGHCILSCFPHERMQECNDNNAIAFLDSFVGNFQITNKSVETKNAMLFITMQSKCITIVMHFLHYCVIYIIN